MVLLYEPDPDLVPQWQYLLESLGHTVEVAATLAAVWERASEQSAALAVVRPAPDVDGWALCQEIQTCIGVPVIGLLPSGVAGEPTADLHVLPLPVAPEALRAVVQRVATCVPV
jgi:DNA-binding response OmpR family regulator